MILFSALCLLKATAPQTLQMVPVVGMNGVFKTKNPPPQIVGFADHKLANANEVAGQHAGLLHQYQINPSALLIAQVLDFSSNLFGRFDVSTAKFVSGKGWMVHHKDAAKKNNFVSYIASSVRDWSQLGSTIDATLEYFMKGYTAAFYDFSPAKYSRLQQQPSAEPQIHEQAKLKSEFDAYVGTTPKQDREQYAAIKNEGVAEKRQCIEQAYEMAKENWSSKIWDDICKKNPYQALFLRAYIYQKRQGLDDRSEEYILLGHLMVCIDGKLNDLYRDLLACNTSVLPKIPNEDSLHAVSDNGVIYETGIEVERVAFKQLSLERKYRRTKEHFDTVVRNRYVYVQRLHQFPHGWGGSNCLFLALSAHPNLFQEVINLLWGNGGNKPNVLNLSQLAHAEYPSLGIELRGKFREWLRSKRNDQFYRDPETGSLITIQSFIVGLHIDMARILRKYYLEETVLRDDDLGQLGFPADKKGQTEAVQKVWLASLTVQELAKVGLAHRKSKTSEEMETIIFDDYINREMGGVSCMPAELYDILSVYLKRRIISVTGPYGAWNSKMVAFQSPRLNQIQVDWKSEEIAPTVYVLTNQGIHHWGTRAHIIS